MATNFPDPTDLYPDVVAAGSLAAMLQAVAAERGFELGPVAANEKQPLHYASVTSATPLRRALSISAGWVERFWSISGWGQGIELVTGSTHDLAEIARAAQLWREGISLRDIERATPFVELCRLAIAAEQGAEQVVAAQWQWLLQDSHTSGRPEQVALIEAAYAEPRLRQLYPYTSHSTLRFSTTTGYPFSPDVVVIEARKGSSYTVRKTWPGDVIDEAHTAGEAVSLAVRLLPANLEPAVSGSYRD